MLPFTFWTTICRSIAFKKAIREEKIADDIGNVYVQCEDFESALVYPTSFRYNYLFSRYKIFSHGHYLKETALVSGLKEHQKEFPPNEIRFTK